MTQLKAKTYKHQVWSSHVTAQGYVVTALVASCAQNCLTFELSLLEPQVEKLTAEKKLDGTLLDLCLMADMSAHLLMQYGEVYAYCRLQLALNTYGSTTLQITEVSDVTLYQQHDSDLQLTSLTFNAGLLVCWGRDNFVTHCTKTQEQLLFRYEEFKTPLEPRKLCISEQSLIFVQDGNSQVIVVNKDL
jgi:hypothetical protein